MKNSRVSSLTKIIVIFSFTINVILFLVLFTPFVKLIYTPLMFSELPSKSEVIIILSSTDAFDTPSGFLDLTTLSRLQRGLELVRSGYASKIICVGGKKLPTSGKSFGRLMKENLVLYGLPDESIFVQDDIGGDWDYYKNLLMIATNFKNQFDLNKAIIVTSPQNMFRIKKVFEKNGFMPIMVSAEKYMMSGSNWHEKFSFFRDILNEYWAILLFFALDRI